MIWSKSIREEIIAALWFIVAILAKSNGVTPWLYVPAFVHAWISYAAAYRFAIKEAPTEIKRRKPEGRHL